MDNIFKKIIIMIFSNRVINSIFYFYIPIIHKMTRISFFLSFFTLKDHNIIAACEQNYKRTGGYKRVLGYRFSLDSLCACFITGLESNSLLSVFGFLLGNSRINSKISYGWKSWWECFWRIDYKLKVREIIFLIW